MYLFPQIEGLPAKITLLLVLYEIKPDSDGRLFATFRPCPEAWQNMPLTLLPDVHETAYRALYRNMNFEPEDWDINGDRRSVEQIVSELAEIKVHTFSDLWRSIQQWRQEEVAKLGPLTTLGSIPDCYQQVDNYLLLALGFILHNPPEKVVRRP